MGDENRQMLITFFFFFICLFEKKLEFLFFGSPTGIKWDRVGVIVLVIYLCSDL